MKIKVLVATPLYEKQTGGPATVARFLENYVAGDDFEVTVCSFERFMKYPTGVRHVLFGLSLVFHVWKSDLVVSLDPVSVGYPVMWVTRFLGKKYILRVPGDFAWEQAVARHNEEILLQDFVKKTLEEHAPDIQKLIRIQSEVASRAQTVIAQTDFLKNIILSWGVAEEQVITIPNAFDADFKVNSNIDIRCDLGIPQESTIIISVGRMIPWKGFERLVDAFDLFGDPDAHLVLVGQGPLFDSLHDYIEHKQSRECIHLLDYVENQTLRSYVQQSDLFVLNTAYEGISNVLLETMALSIPIATTLEGGNADWLVDGQNALIFNYQNQKEINKIFVGMRQDPEKYTRIAETAKQSLESFDPNKVRMLWKNLLASGVQ